jgi:hypothetical protein
MSDAHAIHAGARSYTLAIGTCVRQSWSKEDLHGGVEGRLRIVDVLTNEQATAMAKDLMRDGDGWHDERVHSRLMTVRTERRRRVTQRHSISFRQRLPRDPLLS